MCKTLLFLRVPTAVWTGKSGVRSLLMIKIPGGLGTHDCRFTLNLKTVWDFIGSQHDEVLGRECSNDLNSGTRWRSAQGHTRGSDLCLVLQEKSSGRTAHYKLTSTVMLWLQTNKSGSGTMNLGGSLTRQVERAGSAHASPRAGRVWRRVGSCPHGVWVQLL